MASIEISVTGIQQPKGCRAWPYVGATARDGGVIVEAGLGRRVLEISAIRPHGRLWHAVNQGRRCCRVTRDAKEVRYV